MARQRKPDKRQKPRSSERIPLPLQRFTCPEWIHDALAIAGLLAAVVVFFWPIISQQAFLWEDFIKQRYPLLSYVASELQMGRLPLWNPYLFGGIPILPMVDLGIIYPLNWLLILFVKESVLDFFMLEYQVIGHVFLLGVGTYAFCRSQSISREGAFVAGLIYMLCGKIVHHVFHVEMLHTITWFPLVFLLFIKAMNRQSIRLAIIAGGLLGVMISAGHPQIFVYVIYTLVCYTLFCVVEQYRAIGLQVALLRSTAIAAITVLVGLGLTAITLLPLSELINQTVRPDVTFDVATTYAHAPQHVTTWFMPDFYGTVTSQNADYWGPEHETFGQFWETQSYFGILPLLLAGIALVLKRTPLTLFLGILALITFIASFGDTLLLYQLLYDYIPGMASFRAPARLGLIYGFAVAVMAGSGIDGLRDMDEQDQRRIKTYLRMISGFLVCVIVGYIIVQDSIIQWLAVDAAYQSRVKDAINTQAGPFVLLCLFSIILLGVWYRFKAWHMSLSISVACLLFFDLYGAGYAFNAGHYSPDIYYPRTPLLQFLKDAQAREGGRVRLREGKNHLMARNTGAIYRIHTLEGYTTPLRLRHTTPPQYADELMNVRYRIQVNPQQATSNTLVAASHTMPQAFVVRNVIIAEDRAAVARALSDSTFDYRTTVTLDRPLPDNFPSDTSPALEKPQVTHYEPNHMTIEVDMEKPGVLVIGEVYYDAWSAYVDGEPEALYRANHTMRAVPLAAGSHTVELHYESAAFRTGGVISLMFLLLVCGSLIHLWKYPEQA